MVMVVVSDGGDVDDGYDGYDGGGGCDDDCRGGRKA